MENVGNIWHYRKLLSSNRSVWLTTHSTVMKALPVMWKALWQPPQWRLYETYHWLACGGKLNWYNVRSLNLYSILIPEDSHGYVAMGTVVVWKKMASRRSGTVRRCGLVGRSVSLCVGGEESLKFLFAQAFLSETVSQLPVACTLSSNTISTYMPPHTMIIVK